MYVYTSMGGCYDNPVFAHKNTLFRVVCTQLSTIVYSRYTCIIHTHTLDTIYYIY